MPYESELAVAMQAAEAAAELVLDHYQRFVPIPDAPSNITTETDHAAQELILRSLRHAYPGDSLCAEESTPTLATAPLQGDRLWIVDPIDGTRGFAQKNGEFCIMIGMVDRGLMVVGVVFEPVRWACTFAAKGTGCWRIEGRGAVRTACRVSATNDLAKLRLTQSRSKTARESPVVKRLKPASTIETYSAGLKLAQVATGAADLYVNIYPEFHDWDICAGHILVEEAGGRVTNLQGQPINYGSPGFKQRQGLLASNGALHGASLAMLNAAS
jgi:3'(2'), 5'-bisphosphate nucleotidase